MVSMAFQNDRLYIVPLCRRCQSVQIHISGAEFHGIGFQNRRHTGPFLPSPTIIDVPKAHTCAEKLHPFCSVRSCLREPIAVELEVQISRIGVMQNVRIRTF